MTAVYRIVVQGWSKEDAVREMTSEDFGFHKVWGNLPRWIRDFNDRERCVLFTRELIG